MNPVALGAAQGALVTGGTAVVVKTASDEYSYAKGSTLEPGEASAPEAQDTIKRKLKALEGAQKNAARTRTLPDGRVRYYGPEKAARTPGKTRGASLVTEHNPKTGQVRQWMESYDHAGKVVRVHPKMVDGKLMDTIHYSPATGGIAP